MVRSTPLLAGLALSAALAVAGCGGGGGSGDKTFDNENIGITFKYSPRFHPITEIDFGHTAGAKAAAQSGVALDKVNALIVSRYDLNVNIDKDNLSKFKGEVDNVISRLAGHRVSGQRGRIRRLPGLRVRDRRQDPAPGAEPDGRALRPGDGVPDQLPVHADRPRRDRRGLPQGA